jgi:hypothetical protein
MAEQGQSASEFNTNKLLEDQRLKTLRRSTPSGASERYANTANTRYTGSQAMSLQK